MLHLVMCTTKIMICFLPDPLDKPPDILQFLNKVASEAGEKWSLVGIQLGIKPNQLDVIEEKHPILRYSKVFSMWEKKENADFPFNWRTILNALRSPIVQENRLATKIEKWLREPVSNKL